ncbi:hypothetical protein Pcinc_031417 [Petrolisthes cinctipes]|uniref:SH3 domain-binding protein 5-like n=1 Tax=Petrolisthes cinctipes TaxID=88211 RepID=A0AAE1EX58_PETCI|nr:hypothetical protein Pcinc_031417 [Petrolisthes cinctipes]
MEDVDLSDIPARVCIENNNLAGDMDDTPDPRIQVQLERLNTATDTINKLEVDLDEARMLFRQLLTDSTHRIDVLAKRLGKCVEQSRPYYEARIHAKQALKETQIAAVRYERAMSQHNAAREMVLRTETGLSEKGCIFDDTWQEMLNHATYKVNDAEKEKIDSAAEHRRTSVLYHEAETRVKSLQKELKRAIAKSSLNARRSLLQMNNLVRMHQLQLLPYFELKAAVNQQLEGQKREVKQLEESVARAKLTYSDALATLETISNEIHQNRQSQLDLGVRGIGVGAESPLPPIQAGDQGGRALVPHPHHYAECHDTTTQEFKSLPGQLGPAAAPIMAVESTEAKPLAATPVPHITKAETPLSLTATVKEVPAPSEITEKVMERDEENKKKMEEELVDDVDGGATNTDLTDWQVIGMGSPATSTVQYLTVEDRDSTVSDTESLASIEMLSDEAIDGLMLDEELAAATTTICQPLGTPGEEYGPIDTTAQGVPSFFSYYHDYADSSQKAFTSVVPSQSSESEYTNISQSLAELELHPGNRQYPPPHSLHLHRDSSSDHSSLEDLTPGYAPLRDTPGSPHDFPPSIHDHSALTGSQAASSSSEEAQEPHCSSWIIATDFMGKVMAATYLLMRIWTQREKFIECQIFY